MNKKTVGLWTLALLTFGVGDVWTTYVGLNTPGVMEGNAVPAFFIARYGIFGMIAVKAILVAVACAWYLGFGDKTARYGIPIGLTIIGTTATAWNLYILTVVL